MKDKLCMRPFQTDHSAWCQNISIVLYSFPLLKQCALLYWYLKNPIYLLIFVLFVVVLFQSPLSLIFVVKFHLCFGICLLSIPIFQQHVFYQFLYHQSQYRHVLPFFNLFDSFNTQMELPRWLYWKRIYLPMQEMYEMQN